MSSFSDNIAGSDTIATYGNNHNRLSINSDYGYDHSAPKPQWVIKCTDLPQFDALAAQAEMFERDDKLNLRILCNDTARCAGLSVVHATANVNLVLTSVEESTDNENNDKNNNTDTSHRHTVSRVCFTQQPQHYRIILDYCRQRVTGETMELLFDLADAVGFSDRREAMRIGQHINVTENKPVLNHVLRMPKSMLTGDDQLPDISNGPSYAKRVMKCRQQVADISINIRNGTYKSVTGHSFINTLVIGIGGGLVLGTELVLDALKQDPTAAALAQGRNMRFLSNIDPVSFSVATQGWDARETLVIIVSRQFLATETTLNSRTIKQWMINSIMATQKEGDTPFTAKEIVQKHFMAIVLHNVSRLKKFGLSDENIIIVGDWVNARYSWASAAGLLPLSIHYSFALMENGLLAGAHDMDKHFFHAPLRDNLPVVLGLLGIWNSTFLGYSCRAVFPYSEALRSLPKYIQHIDMESNGKRVASDGTPLLHRSGEINLGACGVDGQYAFFQLLHQGRVIPADFIGFMEPQRAIDLSGEAVSHHDELMSNFFAQPDALAFGKALGDLIQEGTPEPIRDHLVFSGNRPSNSLLMTRMDAFAIGQLMSLFENRTIVQGFIWGINSFDQYGVDLGRVLAKHVRSQISASRKTGASVQGFNSSTSSLLENYLAHGKTQDNAGD